MVYVRKISSPDVENSTGAFRILRSRAHCAGMVEAVEELYTPDGGGIIRVGMRRTVARQLGVAGSTTTSTCSRSVGWLPDDAVVVVLFTAPRLAGIDAPRMVSPKIRPTPTPMPKIVIAAFIMAVTTLVTTNKEWQSRRSRFRRLVVADGEFVEFSGGCVLLPLASIESYSA
jgi:hypothetical protein